MRALAASPLGFLIGLVLGALGAGGSILAVPVLVYVVGQEPLAATTTTLMVVGIASVVGMADHWRAGRVRVAPGVGFGLAGVAGSVAGSALSRRLDPDVLLLAFAGVVLLAAWRMVTGCPSCTNVGEREAVGGNPAAPGSDRDQRRATVVLAGMPIDTATVAKVAVAGTVVGFFTGLFGVGGGFIVVPALTLGLRFTMPEAIGTSLLVIVINASVALAARLSYGSVEWSTALPFTIAAVAGTLTGTRVADRLPARTTLRAFAVLLVAVGTYTAVRSIVALA